MFRTFDELSEKEIEQIANQCKWRHFVCVASEWNLDPHTVAMCQARHKLKQNKDK